MPASAEAQRLGGISGAIHAGGFHGGGVGGARVRGGYLGGGGYAFGQITNMPPWLPLAFPYDMGYPGVRVRQDAMTAGRPSTPDVVGIVDASVGYVPEGIVRGQLSARLRFTNVLDIEARYGAYFEQTPARIDELGIGRIAIAFPLVNEQSIQLRAGVAAQLYHDADGLEPGYAALLEVEGYPVAPLVLHGAVSGGALGHAGFIDARVTVGAQIERGEIYIGYWAFMVAGGTTDTLHGPIVGVRVWVS